MKTKIIGLAAITLALVISMGMASANPSYMMNTSLNLTLGYGFQKINIAEIPDFAKFNEVTIGNFYVNATDLPNPQAVIPNLPAAQDLVIYDKDLKGTGEVNMLISSVFDPSNQLKTITFGQSVSGINGTAVKQITNISTNGGFYVQNLLAATKGSMDLSFESMQVDVLLCRDMVTGIGSVKSATMADVTENSLLFHTVSAPDFDPAIELYQYAAAPGIDFGYSLTWIKPVVKIFEYIP